MMCRVRGCRCHELKGRGLRRHAHSQQKRINRWKGCGICGGPPKRELRENTLYCSLECMFTAWRRTQAKQNSKAYYGEMGPAHRVLLELNKKLKEERREKPTE